ncbi:Quinone-oxidoreductase -like protein, chloroplastic [Capsicum annuum]|nr:Quinone-oxidoreductase -like protein, chloroplastic [Capsicum annuum]KAF3633210.1 Quinone-oxidoreductase -like protein, chloroplastic [Capsicum annuum]
MSQKFGQGDSVPTPNEDEVLLRLEATSLNPLDLRIQKGVARPSVPRKFPVIPCTDVAREVVDVGSSVVKFKAGDKVVALLNPLIGGGLAEYVVAKENLTVPRPEEVSAAEGAGLPIAALTAHKALVDVAGIKLDGRTCGARNVEFVKNLGADEVLDYKTPEGAKLKSPSGQSSMCTYVLKKLTFSKKQLLPLVLIPKEDKELNLLVRLVKEGKLKTCFDSKHPLSLIVNDAFQVAAIVQKLPPLWKDFKNYLKHKRKKMTVEDLIVRLRIEKDNKAAERRSKENSTINGAHIVEDDQNNSKKRKKAEQGSNQPKKIKD